MPDPHLLLDRARSAQARGRDLMGQGKPARARTVLTRALSSLDGTPVDRAHAEVAARLRITLANVEFSLAGWDAAQRRLGEAADGIEAFGLDEVRLSLQNQRGLIALRAGRFAESAAQFDAATPYLAAAPPNERCYLLLNRAVAHMELAELVPAEADLVACIETARAAQLPLLERMATHDRGYVAFLGGDLPKALDLMQAATEVDTTASDATALQGRAEVLVEAGLFREADEVLAAAAAAFRADRLGRDLSEVELDRAKCALALGDPAGARRFAASAARRFRRLGYDAWGRTAELVRIQADLAAGRPAEGLAEAARALQADLEGAGARLPARAAALTGIEACLSAGRVDAAGEWWQRLGPARRGDPITGRMHSYRVAAELATARGDTARARRTVRRGLEDLARYQATFGSIDLRTASAVHGRELAALDIELALRTGRAEAVFTAAERARAVSARLPAVHPPADGRSAELLAQLRQTVDALRAAQGNPEASADLLRLRRQLEGDLVLRSWTRAGAGDAIGATTTSAVRERLAERGESMVAFVQARGRLAAVALDRRWRLHDLGPSAPVVEHVRRARADLDVLADPGLPAPIRTAVRASLRRSLDALDAALLGPLPAAERLVVVSTGVLGQVPWNALDRVAGRPVTVAPSASSWYRAARPGAGGAVTAVAVAGPGLARGAEEARTAAGAWPRGRAVTGEAATTTAFREAVGSATLLHVAAHGVHQPENPLFSFVRMADGPAFAHELDEAGRAPDHVVLSACEVGLATVRPGDEPLGLASALLRLGTRGVVAGVARVGDEAAAEVMAAYHDLVAGGEDSATALARALAGVAADVPPAFVHFGAGWSAGDLEGSSPVA